MSIEKLPRRERVKLRQRQEMLRAALDLFSQKGYHNVSMQEVAARAEFAIGTLYRFFRNKEDLYKALVLEQCEKFDDAISQAMGEVEDEVEKLRNYVRTKGERFRSILPFVRLFLAESRGASFNIKAGLTEEVRKRYDDFLERLALIFERGMQNDRFKNIATPYHLAVALDSISNALLLLWLDAPEKHPYPEDPDTILNILFKGLLNG
ncbi:MAG: TetR/AcrR family transcriptional regulator [Deltaproteobacteria bacterium]|nr:TetR/AcrR family transcriptional regulator [Deltaproteobacteria bacterium]